MNAIEDLLTEEELDPGTEVKVQEKRTCKVHDAVVDERGVVRTVDNGATFNKENYAVVSRGE